MSDSKRHDETYVWDDVFDDDRTGTLDTDDEPTRVLHYEEPATQPISSTATRPITAPQPTVEATASYPVVHEAEDYGQREDEAELFTEQTSPAARAQRGIRLFPAFLGFLTGCAALLGLRWLYDMLLHLTASTQYTGVAATLERGLAADNTDQAVWVWWGVSLALWALSFSVGGYTAARLTRFSRFKQGLAVWLWLVLTIALSTLLSFVAGTHFARPMPFAVQRLADSTASVNALAILALSASALIGSLLGASAGLRYHKNFERTRGF
ncbi:hypothetical protein [Rothia sp. ZJ932]|uniref:hypothetical protein n=1 Tax=Rothia sp. ZJ932 TaxID=2810516 RepID=UPI0019673AA1|nr:hypothetical protein [Rothia sp. ZJ932]QRZ61872.1 hypothetical protein JR346_01675 [Rothia sp. ZJ932]